MAGKLSTAAIPTVAALGAFALAGCGGSSEQKSTASAADVKAQVEQVCRAMTTALNGVQEPLDTDMAAKAQRDSAQIFRNAVGKLNELNTNAGLPPSYKGWLSQFEQLPALNEKAAAAFTQDGILAGQASEAVSAWEAQAEKADALADQAGLTGCLVGPDSKG